MKNTPFQIVVGHPRAAGAPVAATAARSARPAVEKEQQVVADQLTRKAAAPKTAAARAAQPKAASYRRRQAMAPGAPRTTAPKEIPVGPIAQASEQAATGKLPAFAGKRFVVGGLVAAGALTLAAVVGTRRQDSQELTPLAPHEANTDRGPQEGRREGVQHRHEGKRAPAARTTLSIQDHPWDMGQIDEAYANQFKYSYAYSHGSD